MKFLFLGNGTYSNRGCEAIVRGTCEILNATFQNCVFVSSPIAVDRADLNEEEKNPQIISKPILAAQQRGWKDRLLFHSSRLMPLSTRISILKILYKEVLDLARDCDAVLSLGGDFFVGKQLTHIATDSLAMDVGKPVILWGASVGPFSKASGYREIAVSHMKRYAGIFVRENQAYDFLRSEGVEANVKKVADPAFLMSPVEPKNADRIQAQCRGSIGLNISPLYLKHVKPDSDPVREVGMIVEELRRTIGRPIVLTPHVMSSWTNDFHLFDQCIQANQWGDDVTVLSPDLSAAEIKWSIGQMKVYVGSRMHSVIAAYGMTVPTISLAYSPKAIGLNQNMMGDDRFLIRPEHFDPTAISAAVSTAIDESDSICETLNTKMEDVKSLAMSAGDHLRSILGSMT